MNTYFRNQHLPILPEQGTTATHNDSDNLEHAHPVFDLEEKD
jgi:hypothetical protein